MNLATVNLIVLVCIGIIISIFLTVDFKDRGALNRHFKLLSNNKECITYLQAVNVFPHWRISLLFGIGASILMTGYLYLLIKCNISTKYLIYVFFWFSSLLLFTIIYKTISYWNWHYMANDGGLTGGFYTDNKLQI